MAFNPFTNFRKYQKIWMASIMILVMITFVLCTGAGQGDLQNILLRIFRPRGTAYASMDGGKIYSHDFADLKDRRNIANDFMRKSCRLVMGKLDDVLKPENIKKMEQNPKELEQIQRLQELRLRLEVRSRPTKYFQTGVKIDELIDFKVWLAEADRLGVDLNDDAVKSLVRLEMTEGFSEFYGTEAFRYAANEVRAHNNRANEKLITQVLRDEFRVRIAQRVLAQVGTTRVALTPAQLWDFYKEKRVEYRLQLLPLHVEDFVAKVDAPNDTELKIFFEQNRTHPLDPASPNSSFALPSRSKIAWISADPNSDYFKKAAKVALQLETLPPLQTGWQLASGQIAKTAAAHMVFESVRGKYRSVSPTESGADLVVAGLLADKDPVAAAAFLGTAARLDVGIALVPSHWAMGMLSAKNKDAYKAGAQEDLKKRAPIYATLAVMGSTHNGLAFPGTWNYLRFQTEYVPISVVQDELLEFVERIQAHKWVQGHMQALKTKLDNPNISTLAGIDRVLDNKPFVGVGLERVQTKDFWHRFNVQDSKELEPLRKSFIAYADRVNIIEGRNLTPETLLKDTDFWKMFFDGSESFSTTGGLYRVKAWPPEVRVQPQRVQQARLQPRSQIDLEIARLAENNPDANQPVVMNLFNDAERAFLYWRIKDEPPLVPERIEQVRDRVIEAWKFNKARETVVLPRARKIAEAVQKSGVPGLTLGQALDELKKDYQVKREIIPLGNEREPVSPLVPVSSGGGGFGGGQRFYKDFELPAGLINFPRKETAAELLGLYDLKKPIETGYPPLDDINKTLFNEISKDKSPQGKYVQIITNQPRTAFYLAVVRGDPFTSHFDFNRAVRDAFGHDQLFERGQNEAAKRMHDALMSQLRTAHKVDPPTEETRKSFDSDAGN